jgi:hypothetical protein
VVNIVRTFFLPRARAGATSIENIVGHPRNAVYILLKCIKILFNIIYDVEHVLRCAYIYYLTKYFLTFESFFSIQLSKCVFFLLGVFIMICSLDNFLLEYLKTEEIFLNFVSLKVYYL